MILFTLFYEFFLIGLFSVGGGLATLPFLYTLSDRYGWFSRVELIDMIAVSESTPGPLGVNIATFAGYNTAGILGGIIATMGLVVPALIIILLIAKFLDKFKDSKVVQSAFYGIRPAVAALIFTSAWGIVKETLFQFENEISINFINWKAMIVFVILYYGIIKYKKHPALYIGIAASLGIFISF